jgi:gluconate 2-dehydrogenase gamma chain
MMVDQPARQTAMRGGLAWLDRECVTRYEKTFRACTPAERTAVLDDISWPHKARPEVSHGVAFFNAFRDLTASGFWTSRIGIKDIEYLGNVYVPEWTGCPEAVLKKLGVDS